MPYDPSIHHRRSIRLPDYDYSQSGAYFITICTYQKVSLFGEVKRGEMFLNECGLLVENEWIKVALRFPGCHVGFFSIMPNHTHGILVNIFGHDMSGVGAGQEAKCQTRIQPFAPPLRRRFPFGLIIGEFKATTTRLINGLRRTPGQSLWQRNYYEHVIRDDEDYERIAEYILSNPLNWEKDDYYA